MVLTLSQVTYVKAQNDPVMETYVVLARVHDHWRPHNSHLIISIFTCWPMPSVHFSNTTVEEFYKYEEGSNSNAFYYLNNFDSLPVSGVTLFELTGKVLIFFP